MFDFLRNLTKTAGEKRQETVTAYLDGALNNRERQRFEQEMAQDSTLRVEVEQLLLLKQSLRQLPQRPVPRNFILDPAAYGRPARQPWVQAYPVLRTATAMAAFFFIFALAAGIFSNAGGGNSAAFAPAADVAQVEATIEVDSFAFSEEVTADEAMSEVAADAVTEETAAEAEVALAEDSAAEDTAVEEPMAEEMQSDAAEPAPEEPAPMISATAVPTAIDSFAEDITEEAASGVAATPTVSTLPRVTPPTPLPDRDPGLTTQEAEDATNGIVAEVPEAAGGTESVETTAVLPEDAVRETTVEPPVNPLIWLQLGLGILLLLLVGLTIYARRQRR